MVLLTGGAGYIGSHTLLELVSSGFEVLIVDDLSNSSLKIIESLESITKKSIAFEKVDITNQSDLDRIFSKYDINSVIHFAAKKAVGESVENPLKYYHNNVTGLISLLSCCEKHRVKNFVFSSSCTIYGSPKTSPVTEDFEIQIAASPYGNTKQIGEEIISDFANSIEFNYLNLRYFNPIGAHESGLLGDNPEGKPNNLLPYITRVANKELDELTVFGDDYDTHDGTCVRDYIHVIDIAKAHVSALELLLKNKKINDKVNAINLGTGKGYTVLDLINTFEKVTNIKVNYKIGPRRSGDVPAIYADASLAKNILNWEAKLNLEAMLQSAWNFELKKKK